MNTEAEGCEKSAQGPTMVVPQNPGGTSTAHDRLRDVEVGFGEVGSRVEND